MNMLLGSVVELGSPRGAALFNLAAFPTGATAVLERIPEEQSGIYAWFRTFNFSDDPRVFFDELIAAVEQPKFQTRTGDIAPYFGVTIQSKSRISQGKKDDIQQALQNANFRNALRFSLQWSVLFQTPLYIGKSSNLRLRTEQHLRAGSALRTRLDAASIDIEKACLLTLPTDEINAINTDDLAEIYNDDLSPSEELFEEIFSRLFNPSFTVRLG